jgi:prepilin-type N-terminal cleavage/methylation domain-containing protein
MKLNYIRQETGKIVHSKRGFTLIEVLITVAIIGILAAIAYPSYQDYVTRGQLVQATYGLSAVRSQMEQYFQDNRTYVASGTNSPPCLASPSPAYGMFQISCPAAGTGAPSATGYLLTAQGKTGTPVASFSYTVDQNNQMATPTAASGWSTSTQCWLIKKGQTC